NLIVIVESPSGNHIRLYDIKSGNIQKEKITKSDDQDLVYRLSPNKKYLLETYYETVTAFRSDNVVNKVVVYSISDLRVVGEITGEESQQHLEFSPNGNTIYLFKISPRCIKNQQIRRPL